MKREIAPAADLASARAVASVIRAWRPDVIHAHGTKAAFYAVPARAVAPSTPLIRTPHGYAFAGYFTSERAKRTYRSAERLLGPLQTRVLCVCEAERRLAAQVGPEARTRVVHNGTAAASSVPVLPALTSARDQRGGPIVGVVAGLRPGKGIETVVEAWPQVVSRHPNATLAIAGDGPESDRLKELARQTGAGDSIRWLGHSPGAEPVLAGIDVFANPSWAESFPYAVLEAMAFGAPIVATDVGGTGEAIVDGVTGRLVPARDQAALADAVAELLASPDLARRLGDGAREAHTKRFSLEAMIQGTLAVYREVSAGRIEGGVREAEN